MQMISTKTILLQVFLTLFFIVYNCVELMKVSGFMNIYEYLELFNIYKSLLTDKQADIFSLYIECDLSLGEISEIKNISRQGVSDTINKTKELLVSYESKLSLLSKKKRIKDIAENITDEDIKNGIIDILEG